MTTNKSKNIIHFLFLVFSLAFIFAAQSFPQTKPICYYCNKPISGKYITAEGKTFHPEHFRCAACNKVIEGNYVYSDGKFYHPDCYAADKNLKCAYCGKFITGDYITYHGKNYHRDCYLNNVVEKCAVCGQPLEGEIIIDNYNNKYHAKHRFEYPECDCCKRLICEALTGGGKSYSDGRNICNICYRTAVFNDTQIAGLMTKVKNRLSSMGLQFGSDPITIRGVNRNQLRNTANEYSKNIMGHCNSQSEVMTANGVVTAKKTKHDIVVLEGIPQVLMESVIAHELMHAWIYDNINSKQSPQIIEGSCNYIGYVYLKTLPAGQSEEFIKMMNADPDPVYGDGFRNIKSKFDGLPLHVFLNSLKNN